MIKASQDFKRIMKKAAQADMKMLKSKLKEIKKLKNNESCHSSQRKTGSDLLSIVKRISKFPKPSKIIRDKLMSREVIDMDVTVTRSEIEIESQTAGISKSSRSRAFSNKKALNQKIVLSKKLEMIQKHELEAFNKLRRNSTL